MEMEMEMEMEREREGERDVKWFCGAKHVYLWWG